MASELGADHRIDTVRTRHEIAADSPPSMNQIGFVPLTLLRRDDTMNIKE